MHDALERLAASDPAARAPYRHPDADALITRVLAGAPAPRPAWWRRVQIRARGRSRPRRRPRRRARRDPGRRSCTSGPRHFAPQREHRRRQSRGRVRGLGGAEHDLSRRGGAEQRPSPPLVLPGARAVARRRDVEALHGLRPLGPDPPRRDALDPSRRFRRDAGLPTRRRTPVVLLLNHLPRCARDEVVPRVRADAIARGAERRGAPGHHRAGL